MLAISKFDQSYSAVNISFLGYSVTSKPAERPDLNDEVNRSHREQVRNPLQSGDQRQFALTPRATKRQSTSEALPPAKKQSTCPKRAETMHCLERPKVRSIVGNPRKPFQDGITMRWNDEPKAHPFLQSTDTLEPRNLFGLILLLWSLSLSSLTLNMPKDHRLLHRAWLSSSARARVSSKESSSRPKA